MSPISKSFNAKSAKNSRVFNCELNSDKAVEAIVSNGLLNSSTDKLLIEFTTLSNTSPSADNAVSARFEPISIAPSIKSATPAILLLYKYATA